MSADGEDELMALDRLDESVVPPPAPRPKKQPRVPPADDTRELTSNSDLSRSANANGENGSNAQLLALAFAFHPFTALFERQAVARYPRKQSKRACVDEHVSRHPHFYKFCTIADACAVGAITVVFIGTLALGAWKTLFGSF